MFLLRSIPSSVALRQGTRRGSGLKPILTPRHIRLDKVTQGVRQLNTPMPSRKIGISQSKILLPTTVTTSAWWPRPPQSGLALRRYGSSTMRAAAILAAIASLHSIAAASSSPNTCINGVHIIAARGTDEPPGPGLIESVAHGVLAAVPDSQIASLNYPAAFDNYSASVVAGVDSLKKELAEYGSRCPQSKVALMGFSQVCSSNIQGCLSSQFFRLLPSHAARAAILTGIV